MGFRGGGVKLTPPQRILVFKYPSRDRVKQLNKERLLIESLSLFPCFRVSMIF